jgi:hypothetical protein
LSVVSDPIVIPYLLETLKSPLWAEYVLVALAHFSHDQQARAALNDHLRPGRPNYTCRILPQLARMGYELDVPTLKSILESDLDPERLAARRYIKTIRKPEYLQLLRKIPDDSDEVMP